MVFMSQIEQVPDPGGALNGDSQRLPIVRPKLGWCNPAGQGVQLVAA